MKKVQLNPVSDQEIHHSLLSTTAHGGTGGTAHRDDARRQAPESRTPHVSGLREMHGVVPPRPKNQPSTASAAGTSELVALQHDDDQASIPARPSPGRTVSARDQAAAKRLQATISKQRQTLTGRAGNRTLASPDAAASSVALTQEISLTDDPHLARKLVAERFSAKTEDQAKLADQVRQAVPANSISIGESGAAILIEALAMECDGNIHGAMLVMRALQQSWSGSASAQPVGKDVAALAFRVSCRLARTEIGRSMLKFGPEPMNDPARRRVRTALEVAICATGDLMASASPDAKALTSLQDAVRFVQTTAPNEQTAIARRALVCAHKITHSIPPSEDEAQAYMLYRSGVSNAATASAMKTRFQRCVQPSSDAQVEVSSFRERMKSEEGRAPVLTKGTVEQWDMMRSVSVAVDHLSAHMNELRRVFPEPERLSKHPDAVLTAVRLATLGAARKKAGQWSDGAMDFSDAEASAIAEEAAQLLGMKWRFLSSPGMQLKRGDAGWAAPTCELTPDALRRWVTQADDPVRENSSSDLEAHMIEARRKVWNRLAALRREIPDQKAFAQNQDALETAIMGARLTIELNLIEEATKKGHREEILPYAPGGAYGAKANRIARLVEKELGLRGLGAKQCVMRNSAWLPIVSQDLTIDIADQDSKEGEISDFGVVDAWGRWAEHEPLNLGASTKAHTTPRFLSSFRRQARPDEPLSHEARAVDDSPVDPYLPKPSLLPANTGASLDDVKRMLSTMAPGSELVISANAINGPDATFAVNSPSVLSLGVSATVLPSFVNVRKREMTMELGMGDGVKCTAVTMRFGTADASIVGWGGGPAISVQPLLGPWVARGSAELLSRKNKRTFNGVEIEVDCGSIRESQEKAISLVSAMQQSAVGESAQSTAGSSPVPSPDRTARTQWSAILLGFHADPDVVLRDVRRDERGTTRTILLTVTAGMATVFQHLPAGYNAWAGPYTRQASFDLLNSTTAEESVGRETTVSSTRAEANGTNKMGLVGWLPGLPGSLLHIGGGIDSVGMASTGIPGHADSTPRSPITTLVHLGKPSDPDSAFYRTHVFDIQGFKVWQANALRNGQLISLEQLDAIEPDVGSAASGGHREIHVEIPLKPQSAAKIRLIQQAVETIMMPHATGHDEARLSQRIAGYRAALAHTLDDEESWDYQNGVVYVQHEAVAETITTPIVPVLPYFRRLHEAKLAAKQRTPIR